MIELVTSIVVSCMVCFFFMNFHIKQINRVNKQLLEDIEKSDEKFRKSITYAAIDIITEKFEENQ